MADVKKNLANLSNLFSDVKTRTIIIFTLIILLTVIGIGITSFRKSASSTGGSAQVANAPQITSVPGLTQPTAQYAQVAAQANEQRYQQAKKTDGSSIPTVIGQPQQDTSGMAAGFASPGQGAAGQGQGAAGQGVAGQGQGAAGQGQQGAAGQGQQGVTGQGQQGVTSSFGTAGQGGSQTGVFGGQGQQGNNANSAQNAAQQSQINQLKSQQQILQQQLAEATSQQAQQAIQQKQQSMENEAKALLAAWNKVAPQAYVAGEAEQKGQTGQGNGNGSSANNNTNNNNDSGQNNNTDQSNQSPQGVTIKSGDILFAVLDTEVDSDNPGPILATIVSGKLKGTKLVGAVQNGPEITGENGPTSVTLTFNTMSIPELTSSIGVSAVAIDADTANTAMATDVDHHYLLRYGTLFAASFMQGYGNAVTQAGSIAVNLDTGSTVSVHQELNPSEELAAAVGQVGTNWADQLNDIFDRQNTIYVAQGTGLGVLFLQDVTIPTQNTATTS